MVLLDENNRIVEKPWYFIKEAGRDWFFGGERPVPTPAEEVESSRRRFPRRKKRKTKVILKSAKRSRLTTDRSSIPAAWIEGN